MENSRQYNATDGRVYGGDCGLIHISDGNRAKVGKMMADVLDGQMRKDAYLEKRRDALEALNQNLCPGCYMVAGVDMMVELARQNGQSLKELGNSMSRAFAKLADCESYDEACMEEIEVMLDPEEA